MKALLAALSTQPQERPITAAERLRGARLRPTATRMSVLRTIETMSDPFSVSDAFQTLLASDTTLSIATVYRVLADFESAGLLARSWASGTVSAKAMYYFLYPRSGRSGSTVHRLLCRRCGHSAALQDAALLDQLRRFTGSIGFAEAPRCLTIETDGCCQCRAGAPGRQSLEASGAPLTAG